MEFTAGSCISYGWETFKKRPWFLIGATLLYIAVIGIVSGALSEFGKVGPAAGILTGAVDWVFQIVAGMGMTAFLFKAHDDVGHVALADFWHPQPFWYYLGASALVLIVVLGGFILLIVPGIIFSLMFSLAPYLVIDRGLSPMQALHESRRITYGHKWTLFLLGLLYVLVVVVGVVCLLVGILVAIPVVSVANIHALRQLQKIAPAPALASA